MRRRSGLVVLAAVVGPGRARRALRRRPGRHHDLLDPRRRLRLRAALGAAALDARADGLPRARDAHGRGDRTGAHGPGPPALRRQGRRWSRSRTLVVANIGTTCAEFAGVAASLELAGVTRYVSVPIAAVGVSLLVMRGGFRRVEHVLLALASLFVTYIAAGLLAGPDWGATARGLVVPTLPAGTAALVAATATVGTTLAPWGLAFIQSYAVDKRLTPDRLRYERIDVFVGAADDRGDRRVRGDRVRGDAVPRGPLDRLRRRRGDRAGAARRRGGVAALRRGPARRGAAGRVDPAALDRLLDQRDARLRERARRPGARGAAVLRQLRG